MTLFKNIIFFSFAVCFLMACAGNPDSSSESGTATETSSGSGNNYLIIYDYQMQMPGSDSLKPAGNVKLYLSEDAVRSEMKMQMFGAPGQPLVMLGRNDQPDKTKLLNTKNKTYSTLDITMPNELEQRIKEMSSDTLIVIGEEKMNGYACTHLKIVTTINVSSQLESAIGGNTDPSVTEYWVSKDVPGNSLMSKLITSRPEMMKGMDGNAYAYGIPVKMVINGHSRMTMTLTKAEAQNIPDEMFEIPGDYTKEEKD